MGVLESVQLLSWRWVELFIISGSKSFRCTSVCLVLYLHCVCRLCIDIVIFSRHYNNNWTNFRSLTVDILIVYAVLFVFWPCERLPDLYLDDTHSTAQTLNCIDPIKRFIRSPADFVVIFPMNLSRLKVFLILCFKICEDLLFAVPCLLL